MRAWPGGTPGLSWWGPDWPVPQDREPTMTNKQLDWIEARAGTAQDSVVEPKGGPLPGWGHESQHEVMPDPAREPAPDEGRKPKRAVKGRSERQSGMRGVRDVTTRGRKQPSAAREDAGEGRQSARSSQATRTGTKRDAVLRLLARKRGASLEELTAATGWQAHSTRGFLSGTVKKTLGLALVREPGKDGKARYRIEGEPS